MLTLHNDFADFLRLLNERSVRYIVVGGYAVAYHGYPRYTGDLDVFVEASSENADRLVEVYGEFGFDRSALKPAMFIVPDNVVRIGHEPVRLEVLTSITGVAFARRLRPAHRGRSQRPLSSVHFLGRSDQKQTRHRSRQRPRRRRDLAKANHPVARIFHTQLDPTHFTEGTERTGCLCGRA